MYLFFYLFNFSFSLCRNFNPNFGMYTRLDCALEFLSNDLKVSMSAILASTGDRKWVRLRGSNGQRHSEAREVSTDRASFKEQA